MKNPKWLDDFNKELKKIVSDYDKRQKIIKLFNIVLKAKLKQHDEKYKSSKQTTLL